MPLNTKSLKEVDTKNANPFAGNVVLNKFPYTPDDLRIAFVGDMPYDSVAVEPLNSSQRGFLYSLCKGTGVTLDNCFVGNICRQSITKPFVKVGIKNEYVQESFAELLKDLAEYKPNVIITMGQIAFDAFKPCNDGLDNERGAPFQYVLNGEQVVIIPTYHPKELFKRYQLSPLTSFDIIKAMKVAKTGWNYPSVEVTFKPTFEEACKFLDNITKRQAYVACDIETTYAKTKKQRRARYQMTCIGFATNPREAFVIPFTTPTGRYWPIEQEAVIWRKLAKALETCKILGQNFCHFDHEFLAFEHGIQANCVDDTMFAHWECYPEMSKSLAFQSSLHTMNPYHKGILSEARSGKIHHSEEWRYCGLDCCINFQCHVEVSKELREMPKPALQHYRFNVCTSRVFQYMTMKGCRFDSEKHKNRIEELEGTAEELKEIINATVGYKINVRSNDQMKKHLYDELGVKEYKKPRLNTKTGEREMATTADYLTLLRLAKQYPQHEHIEWMGKLRRLQKRISALKGMEIHPRTGRMHWSFGIVSTDTGRMAGYIPRHGWGVQPQNIDRRDRDLCLPDEGMHWLKFDLEGADSVTQAAQLASLGDFTMLHDLEAAMKPALILAIAQVYGKNYDEQKEIMQLSTEELLKYKKDIKEYCEKEKEAGKTKTTYDIMKMVCHGSAYMLKGSGMHLNIFKQSDGDIFVSPNDCEKFQRLIYTRYKFEDLFKYTNTILNTHGFIDTASGMRRTFFGRKDDTTLRAALAFPPQNHTTYVINVILNRLYHAKNNRVIKRPNKLFIDLLNQVHDEGDAQFPVGCEEIAREIFYSTTDVPLKFWGIDFKIDIEGQYGPSWGELPHNL